MFCAYKPPDERNDQFINYLESIVHSLNLENDIFIVGDLNMNWLDNKGEPLKALKHFPFCDHDLVLCECNFKTSKFIPTMIYSRKINEKSLNQMLEEVSGIDFETLK